MQYRTKTQLQKMYRKHTCQSDVYKSDIEHNIHQRHNIEHARPINAIINKITCSEYNQMSTERKQFEMGD